MNKKYELTDDVKEWLGHNLSRIKALISFGDVAEGDLGGYVEKEDNLSQKGNAWVFGDAEVCGDAELTGNAVVSGNAKVWGNAKVTGKAVERQRQGV